MSRLGCSHYDGADTDDGTRHDRAQKPDFTCVHCCSFNPDCITPLEWIEWRSRNIPSRPVTASGKAVGQLARRTPLTSGVSTG
jgi:hypothetical protein